MIIRKRNQKRLSQCELAATLNISNSTIARIEHNEISTPGPAIIRAISDVLDVDYYYLLALTKLIDDEPEIRIIRRPARNLTQEDRVRMVEILRLVFPEAFRNISADKAIRSYKTNHGLVIRLLCDLKGKQ